MGDNLAAANVENQNLPDGAKPDTQPVGNTADTDHAAPAVAPGNPAEDNLKDGKAADGLALSDGELADARKEGAKQDVQDTAKDVHHALTDGNLPGDPGEPFKYHGYDEIQQYAFWLDRPVTDIKAAIKGGGIPDAKAYGLLALERNGQNRTEYVKFFMKALDLDAGELPGGGPSYTNDTTNITDLK